MAKGIGGSASGFVIVEKREVSRDEEGSVELSVELRYDCMIGSEDEIMYQFSVVNDFCPDEDDISIPSKS